MIQILKRLHIYGVYRKIVFFLINHFLIGSGHMACAAKRCLMNSIGLKIGKGTTIVGPIYVFGSIDIGEKCWVNRNFTVHGNGHVRIGNCCDIGPDVSILTGGHAIGGNNEERRAGKGESYTISIEDGCWIGSRATILGETTIHHHSVIAACSCVNKNVEENTLVGGVPAKVIKSLT